MFFINMATSGFLMVSVLGGVGLPTGRDVVSAWVVYDAKVVGAGAALIVNMDVFRGQH